MIGRKKNAVSEKGAKKKAFKLIVIRVYCAFNTRVEILPDNL
jgi:hypothetical protein